MFDIGAFELLLLFLVALLVLGPERLPPLARTLGGWARKAKRMASGLREEFDRELATEDWKKEIERQRAQLRELESKLKEDPGPGTRDTGHGARDSGLGTGDRKNG